MTNDDAYDADAPRSLPHAVRCCASVVSLRPVPAGSQRRRLWQLDGHAHCPIVGVCLPVAALRRLAEKLMAGLTPANDYELHCYTTQNCKSRTPLADAVQRDLDRRYASFLRRAAPCKTADDLMEWWLANSSGDELPGALWAVATHARCSPNLERSVLAEVHMMQHQVGHAERADQARISALQTQCAHVGEALREAQARLAAQAECHRTERESLQAQATSLRLLLVSRDASLSQLNEKALQMRRTDSDLSNRLALQRRLADQDERVLALQRALTQAKEASRRWRAQDELPPATPAITAGADEAVDCDGPLPAQAVLCVGGRSAVVPIYRQLVERRGARFSHHDGGEKDNVQRLEATLSAADLVICQTGCISHDAYWRVKDHCKRTGKRCLFVDNPSAASLRRALDRVASMAGESS